MSPNRPLTRREVGAVLRILLPVVTGFCWCLAIAWFTISDDELANSIALRTLDNLPSLDYWAGLVAAGALAMTVALLLERRPTYVYALAVVLGVFLVLAIVYAVAAFNDAVSKSAWAWPAFVAFVCAACIRGLTTREG